MTPIVPQRIIILMIRILHFIMACIFIVAGASPVPACYASKPDCDLKAKPGCPMLDSSRMNVADNALPCCLSEMSGQEQQSTVPFPVEWLKRLKIEQIQYGSIDLPPFVPTLVTRIIIKQPAGLADSHRFIAGYGYPIHPPPPLFLQHQSFLI